MGLTRADLTTIATRTGYPVRSAWVPGHGLMGAVVGVILHHTATPDSVPGDYPSLGIVTHGRSDLPGSLCNFGLGRSGTIYLVTEGIAYHAGVGTYGGVPDGNGHFLGIEAENGGTGRPWPPVQLDSYRRLVASSLYFLGRTTDWDVRHATFATPTGRKIDTAGFDMARDFDPYVRLMLANPASINRNYQTATPVPTPPPRLSEDSMIALFREDGSNEVYVGNGMEYRLVANSDDLKVVQTVLSDRHISPTVSIIPKGHLGALGKLAI